MKNKKGQAVAWVFIGILVLAFIGGGIYLGTRGPTTEGVVQQTAQAVADASKSGDVASIGIYVRNIANNDVNTKVVSTVYCQSADGTFIIDGTSSSASAEITGKTTVGDTVTCWAFGTTYQTVKPTVTIVDAEVEHIVIDAFEFATSTEVTVYDSTLTSANLGATNISVGADGSDSFAKMKLKNNDTDSILPLGGIFFDVAEATNISNIDMAGSIVKFGFTDTSAVSMIESDLSTDVAGRKSQWDYVFTPSADANGNNVLMIEENDYIETSPITVSSSVGCTAGSTDGGTMTLRGFISGYYRETKNTGVAFGIETDASSASAISSSTDLAMTTIYCE